MSVSSFYKLHVANNQPVLRDRSFFLKGARIGLVELIKDVSNSIFYLLLTICTLGISKEYRHSLLLKVSHSFIDVGVLGIGLAGLLFPQTINQKYFHLPANGIPVTT